MVRFLLIVLITFAVNLTSTAQDRQSKKDSLSKVEAGSRMPSDTTFGSRMYLKCVKDGIAAEYHYLRADSLHLISSQSEQWQSPVKAGGKWAYSNEVWTLRKGDDDKKYSLIKVRSLYYLVGYSLKPEDVKLRIDKCLREANEDVDPQDSDDFKQEIEFRFARSCICESDILVEVPQKSYIFEGRVKKFNRF